MVTRDGGPKFLVDNGVAGYVVNGEAEFASAVLELHGDKKRRSEMRQAARQAAERFSWSAVIDQVYCGYDAFFATAEKRAGPSAWEVARHSASEAAPRLKA